MTDHRQEGASPAWDMTQMLFPGLEGLDQGSSRSIWDLTRSLVAALKPGQSQALPRLPDVHPGPLTGGRWIGMRTVPTECIRGTASTSTSRGRDFRPLKGREPADWESRWSRLSSRASALAILPPIQLVRAGGDYWVVDGHNRVALAKERGQLWIDADVTELDVSSEHAAAAA